MEKFSGLEKLTKQPELSQAKVLFEALRKLNISQILAKLTELKQEEQEEYMDLVTTYCYEKGADLSSGDKEKCDQLLKSFADLKKSDNDDLILENYPIQTEKMSLVLKSKVNKNSRDFTALKFLDEVSDEFEYSKIDIAQSQSPFIKISDNLEDMGARNLELVLRIFKLSLKTGEKKKILYIADRYVSKPARGQGLGKQLLQVIDKIAKVNDCQIAYGVLMPEKAEQADEDKLVSSHQKAGYQIFKLGQGAPVAVKNYK